MQVLAIAASKGVTLPQDFLTAAEQGGLRQGILHQFLKLQVRSAALACNDEQSLSLQSLHLHPKEVVVMHAFCVICVE